MPYIGKNPTVGNFVKLDAITTSATDTFNLTNGTVAYYPQSPNHCIVSLNGVIQSPTTSFTISGSTIVFASALTATDVIDFILVLGDVLNIGTPSDATVGFAKVTSNLITGATAETSIAGGDSVLIYDDSASALRKMTRTNFVSGLTGGTQEFAAGTVSLPSITTTGDTNTGVFFPAADTIAFTEGGTEAMRITSAGELFIGSTSHPVVGTEKFGVNGVSTIAGAFGTTSTGSGTPTVHINNSTNGTSTLITFSGYQGGTVGSISTNGTSTTSYNTSSDYRLKENVNYNFNAITKLKQLKPARFNFITEPNKTVDGFLAHEVQDIIPEAIHGIKDETETKEKVVVSSNGRVIAQNIEQADWEAGKILNEEGKSQYPIDSTWEASKVVPVYQGIDQAKLTPILTKALQEAITKIEQLEARLTALENN